ncbi:synaptonemal complex protein [Entamoeba marina]
MEVVSCVSIQSDNSSVLNMNKGDIIRVDELTTSGLWKGSIGDQKGYFNATCVSLKNPPLYLARVLYDFGLRNSETLPCCAGQYVVVIEEEVELGWAYCQLGVRFGYIPFGYIEKINFDKTSGSTKTRMTRSIREATVTVKPPTYVPCKVVAKYDYVACIGKDINFSKNDEMICLSSCENKWLYVYHPTYGLGYVPLSYVTTEDSFYHQDIHKYAIVLYDFEGDTRFHLKAEVGDIVFVDKVVASWAVISVNGEKYIFPYLYLSIFYDERELKIDERMAIVLHEYYGQNDNELSLLANEFVAILYEENNGWTLVKRRNKIGYFPTSFLFDIFDNDRYAVIINDAPALVEGEMDCHCGEIWLVESRVKNGTFIGRRGKVKSTLSVENCEIKTFEKPKIPEFDIGKERLEKATAVLELEREKRDAEEKERREEEEKKRAIQMQHKKRMEEKKFFRQTMKSSRKQKSNTLLPISNSKKHTLIDVNEIETKKALYDQTTQEGIDKPVHQFSSSVDVATLMQMQNESVKKKKKEKRKSINEVENKSENESIDTTTKESDSITEEPTNITPNDNAEHSKEDEIQNDVSPTQKDGNIDIKSIQKENIKLRNELEKVSSSQTNILKIFSLLKDELRKIGEANKSVVQQPSSDDDNELLIANQTIQTLTEQLEQTNSTLTTLQPVQQQLNEAQQLINQLTIENQNLKQRNEELQSQNVSNSQTQILIDELNDVKQKHEDTLDELSSSKKEIVNLKEELNSVNDQMDKLHLEIDALVEEKQSIECENKELKEKTKHSGSEFLKDVEEIIQQFEERHNHLKQQHEQLEKKCKRLVEASSAKKFESLKNETTSKINQYRDELRIMERKLTLVHN